MHDFFLQKIHAMRIIDIQICDIDNFPSSSDQQLNNFDELQKYNQKIY